MWCVQVLKLLAEMSPFCGDMEKVEANLLMLFEKLLVSNSLAQPSNGLVCFHHTAYPSSTFRCVTIEG